MVIERVKVNRTKKRIVLSALIRFNGRKVQRMYFSTDREHESFIATDTSPFLAAVLIPCMKTGEDISIHGSISAALLCNTKSIMDILTSWNRRLRYISISADVVKKDTYTPHATASFFSAGVDSFYTYLTHRTDINTFIFVHGFDIELSNRTLYEQTVQNIRSVAREETVRVIPVKTNLRYIIEPVYTWDWVHGGALAAVGLFLRKNLAQLYISSALKKDRLVPYGTHPQLDHHWGTERLAITHYGTDYSRFEKTLHYIAKSDFALSYLRVCAQNTKGTYNCSRCPKCLRTMIQLAGANALQKAKTFTPDLDLDLVRNMYYDYSRNYQVDAEPVVAILEREQREPVLLRAIKESLEKSQKGPSMKKKVVNLLASFDQQYNDRRLYRFVFSMNKLHDRNIFFKTFVTFGIMR